MRHDLVFTESELEFVQRHCGVDDRVSKSEPSLVCRPFARTGSSSRHHSVPAVVFTLPNYKHTTVWVFASCSC